MTPEEEQQLIYSQQAQERDPGGVFGSIIDIFSRPSYFAATFADEIAKNGFDRFGDALMAGLAEAIDPQRRTNFKDVIKRVAPDMNDTAASILGTAGDVVFDPLNAFSLGSLGATKIFGRSLSLGGLNRYRKEIGDAVEAAGWGVKKVEALTEMAKGVTDSAGRTFLRSLIGDTIAKLGPEVIGNVPNSDLLPTVLRGLGVPIDDAYAKALAHVDDWTKVVERDFGSGTVEKTVKYLDELRNSPAPAEKLVREFGRDIAEPVMAHLDARGTEIMNLADKVKMGTAHPLEAAKALDLVKEYGAIDPEAVAKFQRRYPKMAANVANQEELFKEAYRTAEKSAARKIAEVTGLEVDAKELATNFPKHELLDEGGLKILGKTIVSSEWFDKVSRITGLKALKQKALDIKGIQGLVGAFNRNFNLPEEYLKLRQDLERGLQSTENDSLKDAAEIFTDLKREGRQALGKTGTQIDVETALHEKALTEANVAQWQLENPGKEISPQTLKSLTAKISDRDRTAIIEKAVRENKLQDDPKLFSSFVKLMHGMNEIGMKNLQAGLTEEMSTQFNPLIHEIIDNPQLFKIFQKTKGMGTFEDFAAAGFKSIDEAIAAGYQPEMDAITLYMNRALLAKQELAKKNFNDVVKITYGNLKEMPAHIRRDIKFIGDQKMPAEWSEFTKEGLKLYDTVQNMFKKYATSVRPAFGARQLFSNSLQQYLALGPQAMHAFDPRSQMDALAAVMHHYGAIGENSSWLEKSVIQTPSGRNITGREFAEKLRQWGVIRGGSLSGEAYERDAVKSLEAAIKNYDFSHDRSRAGFKKLLSLGIKHMNIPSYIEDMAHASLFANALRMGYDDRSAINLVNSTLFDYQHGLSRFGRQIGQRLFPFFSYTNFAVPFLSRVMATHPNRIVNVSKTFDGLMTAMNSYFSGEHLNPSERAALPGFLLEQNNYLHSLSPQGQAVFRTFNNFSPLDVLGGMKTDDKGDIDLRNTLINNVLSQVAPAIKMPMEWLMNKSFFTGQTIQTGEGKKNIGMQDFNRLLGNMVGLVMAGKSFGGADGGNVAIGLASKFGTDVAVTPEIVQDSLKNLMGWEEGIDHRTGKDTVYVNPWMIWGLTNIFPSLGQAIRVSRTDHTPTDNWLDFMAGVGTFETDLPRNVQIRVDEENRQIRDQKYRMRAALREGRTDDYTERLAELEDLLKTIAEERAKLSAFPIRGTQ